MLGSVIETTVFRQPETERMLLSPFQPDLYSSIILSSPYIWLSQSGFSEGWKDLHFGYLRAMLTSRHHIKSRDADTMIFATNGGNNFVADRKPSSAISFCPGRTRSSSVPDTSDCNASSVQSTTPYRRQLSQPSRQSLRKERQKLVFNWRFGYRVTRRICMALSSNDLFVDLIPRMY